MDRRLLFPIAAVTAWAQQPSPEAAAAETAVRARANEFFQLQVDKKYRQAESMVADESKDAYYAGQRFNISNYTIAKIELTDGNTAANVTIKAKVTVLVAAIGKAIQAEALQTTRWKTENGEWVYVVDAQPTTPFGTLNPQAAAGNPAASDGTAGIPNLRTLERAVQVDRNSVEMKPGERQIVTISNLLPGPVDVNLESFSLRGLSASLDKQHLEQRETASLQLVASDTASGSATLRIAVAPLGTQLSIKVTVK